MNILITGGAGFVGGNLAVKFAAEGHNILCLDNMVRRGSELNLQRFLKFKNISFVHGDIRNEEDLCNLNFKTDVVLECAAQPSAIDGYANPYYDFANNTLGLMNLLEYCRKNDAGMVFWSTNKAYDGDLCNSVPVVEGETRYEWDLDKNFQLNGWTEKGFNEDLDINGGNHSIYGISKIAADLLCQEWSSAFDIPIVCNRFSCLYGPHQFGKVSQGWVAWFVLAKLLNKPITYYGFKGKQVRDCLHIDDIYSLIGKQIINLDDHRGSYYNVGGGPDNSVSLIETNDMLNNMLNINQEQENGYDSHQRRADQILYISDISKVCKDFDWKPEVSVQQGLESVISWANDGLDVLQELYF